VEQIALPLLPELRAARSRPRLWSSPGKRVSVTWKPGR